MQTNLAPEFKGTPDGLEAEAILRKCVLRVTLAPSSTCFIR